MRKLCALIPLLLAGLSLDAVSAELREPPTFYSSDHQLDLLVIAKAKTIQLDEFSPAAWIYEVCYRRDAVGDACPNDARTASEYGGMRLQLQPGDHLKLRFINHLPPAPPDCEHLHGEMGEMLKDNPTNLHTHGLIVEPRRATPTDPSYGDYVYVLAYPKGKLPDMQMPGLDYTDKPLDYDIYVPQGHPSGLFWIHPHVHGLALNQMSYGLAGIITIGSPRDYLGGSVTTPESGPAGRAVRHLALKDMQVLPDGSVLSQEDPDFCEPDPSGTEQRNGYCPRHPPDEGENDYTAGKWFFTINGQVFPTITVNPTGEVWRITQASGSRSYELTLRDDVTGKLLLFQILAVDGVTVSGGAAGSAALARATGGKFVAAACAGTLAGNKRAVCATVLRMMPSSRIEIWVPSSPQTLSATLHTRSFPTGPDGDDWPSADLAHVVFTPAARASGPPDVKGAASKLLSASGVLGAPVKIAGPSGELALDAAAKMSAQLPAGDQLREHVASLSASADIPSAPCASLPPGHRRRIYFGVPPGEEDGFGLGYEEVDQDNQPVEGTFRDITEFNHQVIDVCLPLVKGNTPVTELWELVNVAGEDHNFHIHQTKFRVLSPDSASAPPTALMDNLPVPHGAGACDGSVANWRSGACRVKSVFVSIPFSQVGDFVYHCHILEHEDGGMMAHIRVVPSGN